MPSVQTERIEAQPDQANDAWLDLQSQAVNDPDLSNEIAEGLQVKYDRLSAVNQQVKKSAEHINRIEKIMADGQVSLFQIKHNDQAAGITKLRLAMFEASADVLMEEIGIDELLSDERWRMAVVQDALRLLNDRRAIIMRSVEASHMQIMKRIFPSNLAEVDLPSDIDRRIPAVNKWQRVKGLSRQVADRSYIEYTQEAAETATEYFQDGIEELKDDDAVYEVDAQVLRDSVRQSIYEYNQVRQAGVAEEQLRLYISALENGHEESAVSKSSVDALIVKWVKEGDQACKEKIYEQISRKLQATLTELKQAQQAAVDERALLKSRVAESIVEKLVAELADGWRHQVHSIFNQGLELSLDQLVGSLDSYSGAKFEQVRPANETGKGKRNRLSSVTGNIAINAVKAEQPPSQPVSMEFDWLEDEVPVSILTVNGKKIAYAEAISNSLRKYFSALEGPREVAALESFANLAKSDASDFHSWKIARQKLPNVDQSRFPAVINKYSKKGGVRPRAYYALLPASDELQQQGVDRVLVLIGACAKNDQDSFLAGITTLTRKESHQRGAGAAGR